MQIVLRIRRTMTGEEIDRAIATVAAGQTLAVERLPLVLGVASMVAVECLPLEAWEFPTVAGSITAEAR